MENESAATKPPPPSPRAAQAPHRRRDHLGRRLPRRHARRDRRRGPRRAHRPRRARRRRSPAPRARPSTWRRWPRRDTTWTRPASGLAHGGAGADPGGGGREARLPCKSRGLPPPGAGAQLGPVWSTWTSTPAGPASSADPASTRSWRPSMRASPRPRSPRCDRPTRWSSTARRRPGARARTSCPIAGSSTCSRPEIPWLLRTEQLSALVDFVERTFEKPRNHKAAVRELVTTIGDEVVRFLVDRAGAPTGCFFYYTGSSVSPLIDHLERAAAPSAARSPCAAPTSTRSRRGRWRITCSTGARPSSRSAPR